MSLRTRILLFLFIFALVPLLMAVVINLPLVLERVDSFYRHAFLQNLRADFSDLDQHLASRDANVRLLARLPEPSVLSQQNAALSKQLRVNLERARYVEWINRILREERDITQIRFLDRQGKDRFWMKRDSQTHSWFALAEPLPALPERQLRPLLNGGLKDVQSSPLRVDLESEDPARTLTLQMMAPIFDEKTNVLHGAVVITIDIGFLVRRNVNTFWALDEGNYLQLPDMPQRKNTAFIDFPGLEQDFKRNRIVLWEGDKQRMIWVPMLATESGAPLWVGRAVNMAPLLEFQSEIVKRVLAIILGLVVLLLFSARLLANRAEHIGSELIGGIQKTLEADEPVEFEWTDNKELRQLSVDLTKLSQRHASQSRNLREHTRELEASNRYKSEFLANVSHELRTPLNSILLLSKLLSAKDAGLSQEQNEQATVIHKASNDLKALIDNILDLSKIEARQLDVHCERIEISELLNDVRELLQPQFKQKQLSFVVKQDEEAPLTIESDANKIRQVLKNFLANALKFTQQGEVRLEAVEASAPYAIEIKVIDSGIGIAEEKQTKIFEAFQQADGSTSRRYGGTGLGLTISRQIAQILGGEIRLRSKLGEGAVFSILLPALCTGDESKALPDIAVMEAPIAEALPDRTPLDMSGVRVMLVDADIKVQLQLTQYLKAWQAEVLLADDLEEALDSIDDSGAIDILVIDPLLPDEDACATISKIREVNKDAMKLVGLVYPDTEPSVIVCEAIMPDHTLSKPVQASALEDVFRSLLLESKN